MNKFFLVMGLFFSLHGLAWAGGDAPPPVQESAPADPAASNKDPAMDGGGNTANLSCRAGYVVALKWKHGASTAVCIKK